MDPVKIWISKMVYSKAFKDRKNPDYGHIIEYYLTVSVYSPGKRPESLTMNVPSGWSLNFS